MPPRSRRRRHRQTNIRKKRVTRKITRRGGGWFSKNTDYSKEFNPLNDQDYTGLCKHHHVGDPDSVVKDPKIIAKCAELDPDSAASQANAKLKASVVESITKIQKSIDTFAVDSAARNKREDDSFAAFKAKVDAETEQRKKDWLAESAARKSRFPTLESKQSSLEEQKQILASMDAGTYTYPKPVQPVKGDLSDSSHDEYGQYIK